LPLPVGLPPFPDVSGNGVVSALDALQVINELARSLNLSGGSGELVAEGEMTSYVPMSGGVLAAGTTVLGDVLIAETRQTDSTPIEEISTVVPSQSKISVFDSPAVVQLESIVDSLAEDTAAAQSEEEVDALDQLFASL
jgi:hypothetical protein